MFTYSVVEFGDFAKIVSWITLIPLATLCFRSEASVIRLRFSAVVAFSFIFIGLTVANIFRIGNSAYDSGIFYLGWWYGEASVSMSIICLVPYFLLPRKKENNQKLYSLSTIGILLVSFLMLVLIMKRSSILGFVLCFFSVSFLAAVNKRFPYSMRKFVPISIVFAAALVCGILYLQITRPDLIRYRFKDYYKYKKSGDMSHFGAGRLGLMMNYFNVYMSGSVSKKIFGVDIGGYIDKEERGYLHLGREFRLDPHNDYIEFLLNNGAVGLVLLLAFLFQICVLVLRIFRTAVDLLTLRLCVIMGGMLLIYFVGSIAGMIFRVVPMTCFALLLGCLFGAASQEKNIVGELG